MKFEAFIVEDNEDDYNRIAGFLTDIPDVKLISKYLKNHPYSTAIEQIKFLKPNLLIIDHELNGKEGLNGLDLFHEVAGPYVFAIFCSQHDEASDNDSLFLNAKFAKKDTDQVLRKRIESRIDAAREYFRRLPDSRFLSVRIGEDDVPVHFTDICYLEAEKDHTHLYLFGKEKAVLVKKGIGEIIERYQLESLCFIKVSKSYVVNMFRIISIRPNPDILSRRMVLVDHAVNKPKRIPISKEFFKSLRGQYFLDRYKK